MGILGALSAVSIRSALTPTKGGKFQCPVCGGNNLSVNEGQSGKPLVKCWTSKCEYREIITKLGMGHNPTAPPRSNGRDGYDEETAKRVRLAKYILRAARKVDLSPEAYLEGRGIKHVPDNAYLLPASEARRLKLSHPSYPRVVVPVVNLGGDEVGCHTILLTKDMSKNLRSERESKNIKRSYGVLSGNYVRLGDPEPNGALIVAEGVETALSASEITGLPALATLGTAFLASVDLPGCSEAIICADSGASGTAAAEALAQRLTIPTRIAIPNGPDGYDWNDARRDNASVKVLKKLILNAKVFERKERMLTTRPVAEFALREFEWLWQPFIPRGAVTTMFGDGGAGKSTITIDIAARLSTQRMLPLGDDPISGSVLIMTKEDDIASIVRPRLEAAKADLTRVHIVGYAVPDNAEEFDPVDRIDTCLADLEREIIRMHDVKLLIVDPAADFAGNLDLWKDADVRKLITPLQRMASRHDLAVIIIVHINKSVEQAAGHRGMGSLAFRNAPRSALLVAVDPKDADHKWMVQTKGNLTASGNVALGFRTQAVGKYTHILWDDELDVADPAALLSHKKPKQAGAGGKAAQGMAGRWPEANEIH